MFSEVHSALKLDQHPVAGKLVNLVEEKGDLGGFLIHHFVADAVKSEGNVVLVGLEQTLGHYHSVGIKLGVDIIKKQKAGTFVFVDLLKSVCDTYASRCDDEKRYWNSLLEIVNSVVGKIEAPRSTG